MTLIPVLSTNVAAVGYDGTTSTMRVQFQNGGTYDYLNVAPSLYAAMLDPYPWRRVGHIVKAHEYRKIA